MELQGLAAHLMDEADRAAVSLLAEEKERLRRENRDLQFVLAILLRKLGGETFISDGEQVAEDATLIFVPAKDGYRLLLRERVPFNLVVAGEPMEETSLDVSETGRGATDKGV